MARFVVDLGNMPISPEKQREISAAIQAAVLSLIADNPAAAKHQALLPNRWPGMIHRETTSELTHAEQQIESFANAP
jgi:hypothetical protein